MAHLSRHDDMSYGRALLGVVTSAVLFVLALPPADIGLLGWIALVPLLWGVQRAGFTLGFVAGLLVGVLAGWFAALGWFYAPSLVDGNPGWIYTGFSLFGAVIGGVSGASGEVKRWTPMALFATAALAVLLEMGSMLLLPVHLALTQYRTGPALALAATTGIWGVSYLLWLSNLTIAASLATRRRGLTMWPVSVAAGLLTLGSLFARHPAQNLAATPLAAMQTDKTGLAELGALNMAAGQIDGTLVVWPELSAQFIAPGGDTAELKKLAKQQGQPAFVTTFRDDNAPLPHNAASVFSREGESARYFKRRPFAGEKSIHLAGVDPVAVQVGGIRMGLNICYDSCFPAVMRDTVRQGAMIVLLPTLDPAAPCGVVQALHASYTPFRAAELGVPVVRADVTAYSMIVNRDGHILAEAKSGTEETIHAMVQPGTCGTRYLAWGDWFLYVCTALVIAWILSSIRFHKGRANAGRDIWSQSQSAGAR